MKKYAVAAAIVLCFSITATGLDMTSDPIMPSVTAQWDDGTADNDDGGDDTSDSDSSWDDGTADGDDSSSDSDSTDESTSDDSWDDDTANNDNGDSGGSWDNETADNNEDAWNNETADNNDDGTNESSGSWDNETADNNEDAWNNETAENDDSQDSETIDDSTSDSDDRDSTGGGDDDTGDDSPDNETGTDDPDGPGEDNETTDDSTSTPGSGASFDAELRPSETSLSISLSSNTVSVGEEVTVSGRLEGGENEGKAVTITVDGQEVATTETDSNGGYSTSFAPENAGTYTIRAEATDEEAQETLQVTSATTSSATVQITSIVTSSNLAVGRTISVCPTIVSETDAKVELLHNGNLVGQKEGTGRVCFDVELKSGENRFEAIATVPGDSDEAVIVRSPSRIFPQTQGRETTPSGGFFLSSTSSRIFIAALLGLLITAFILYREGVRFRDIRL